MGYCEVGILPNVKQDEVIISENEKSDGVYIMKSALDGGSYHGI